MKRRNFLKGLAVAAGAALIPWTGAGEHAPVQAAPATLEPSPPGLAPKPARISCPNCGQFEKRVDSEVCSPLCNWYKAQPLIDKLGLEAWQEWRAKSIEFMEGRAAFPWEIVRLGEDAGYGRS